MWLHIKTSDLTKETMGQDREQLGERSQSYDKIYCFLCCYILFADVLSP